MAVIEREAMNAKELKGEVPPDWCPGCGDYGVLNCLQRAIADLGIPTHENMVISGIGCSSNLPGFINTYGMHTLHGRSLPIAQGAKMANHAMNVVACGGDGDGYGIGVGHAIHAMRRNIDMTYIVMNNSIYGLTTGQTSPASGAGMKTKSTPFGNPEPALNPAALAIGAGASFFARGFSGNPKHLVEIMKEAMRHPGFAIIDTFSPCVTFNKVNTAQFYRDNTIVIDESHDKTDKMAALALAHRNDGNIPIGVYYQEDRPCYESTEKGTLDLPLVEHELGIKPERAKELVAEFQ